MSDASQVIDEWMIPQKVQGQSGDKGCHGAETTRPWLIQSCNTHSVDVVVQYKDDGNDEKREYYRPRGHK